MRIVSKALSVVLLGSILLSACGAVTPIAPTVQVTATLQPTSTFAPTPSETPSPVPAFVPSPTSFLLPNWHYTPPDLDSTKYKLKTWTDGDYAFFIEAMDKGKLFESNPWFLQVFESFYGYEYFLRGHEINPDNELDWAIARMAPIGMSLPGMRNMEEYINFLMEKLLNENHVSLNDLPNVLQRYGFHIGKTFPVKGFYGKTDDALFIDVYLSRWNIVDEGEILGIHQVYGEYQVDTIKGWQWMDGLGMGRDYSFESAIDTNNNDLPELVIKEYEGHSGQPPHDKVTLWLYEWDKQTEKYRSNFFDVFSQWCDEGACDGKWELRNDNKNNIPTLVTQEKWNTQTSCPNLIVQSTYQWDGKEYPLREKIVLPSTSEKPECLIDWAETAIRIQERGWENNQAIQIISDALNQWPDAMDKDWGPASRDYFRLRLGIWKDLRGESDETLKLLEPLAKTPFIAEYSLPSQTAAIYLRDRNKAGILKACQVANETWNNSIQKGISDPFDYSMADIARKFLGFASDLWWESIYSFSTVCSEDDAIYSMSQNSNNPTSMNPVNWFTKVGRSVYLSKREDFDGDGKKDWLVVAQDSKDSSFSSAWFFFSTPNHFISNKFAGDRFDAVSPSKWLILTPGNDDNPVYLLNIGKAIWIFRVNHDEKIETLIDDYNVKLLQLDQIGEIKIKVSSQDPNFKGEKIKNYVWDDSSKTFVTVVEEYDFETAQANVERMIFHEHNFVAAIVFIQKFLAKAPVELQQMSSCDPSGCEYYPLKYYPYMYYMLGLSYEMSNQPEEAARTYYLLWKDYSESPYALLAQSKLTPVAP